MQLASGLLALVLVADVYSAPQFITFKDGKLGVNFGGYHAGVGFGGPGGNGALYAEAGTPHGQSAMAGLGGAFGTKGGYTGGLFAGAQAAENVHASAGLGGLAVGNGYATGNGFATAQAGSHVAASGMGGHSSSAGSTGYKVQSFGIPATVVKETEVAVAPIEVSSEKKKVHKEIKFEAENEVNPLPLDSAAETHIDAKVDFKTESQPTVLVKEVYVEPQPQIIEKTKIHTHYKPQHHHVHKTAYIGGYLGGGADLAPPAAYTPIQKRVDLGVEGSENVEAVDVAAHGQGGAQTTITKEVSVDKNPTFFADIFNIPISTLQAVGSFLSNTAANTKVSVQKSATIQADSDTTSSKHAPLSSSSSSLSDTQLSVETPSVSQIIDGIFSNVLGSGVAPSLKLNDGHEMPVLGLGTWLGFTRSGGRAKAKGDEIQKAVEWALDAGYRHIDTAFIYDTETQVGNAIRKKIAEGVVKREELFVTTKLWNNKHAQADVVPALKLSLEKLGLDYVDLYLIHWPIALSDDGSISDVDYLGTWRGMVEAREQGFTRSIGVSNFNQHQLERLIANTSVVPQVLQVELNLNLQQPALREFCRTQNITVTGYTPFGSLFYSKAAEDAPLPRIDTPELVAIAQKYKKTVPQINLRYLIELGVITIPKTTTKSRVEENLAIFDFHLTHDEKALLKSYDKNYRTISVKHLLKSPFYPFEK